MDKQEKRAQVYEKFQTLAPRYDRANARISLGLEKSWKRLLVKRLTAGIGPGPDSRPAPSDPEGSESRPAPSDPEGPASRPAPSDLEGPASCPDPEIPEEPADMPEKGFGEKVLDVCCGTGDIAAAIAAKRPDLKVTGLDFSPAMLAVAKEKGEGLPNLQWVQGDALNLPFADGTFAAACISFGLRNTPDYGRVLREMKRVVRPGGKVYCLDSFVPDNPVILPAYRLYFRHLMPLLGGGRKYRDQYRWLWQSTEQFPARRKLMGLFARTGLAGVQSRSRMFGACVLIEGTKP